MDLDAAAREDAARSDSERNAQVREELQPPACAYFIARDNAAVKQSGVVASRQKWLDRLMRIDSSSISVLMLDPWTRGSLLVGAWVGCSCRLLSLLNTMEKRSFQG